MYCVSSNGCFSRKMHTWTGEIDNFDYIAAEHRMEKAQESAKDANQTAMAKKKPKRKPKHRERPTRQP